MWVGGAKRLVDALAAATLLLCALPLLVAHWLVVRVTVGRSALFSQARLGKGGRVFVLWKLRTMTEARGEDGQLLPDQERLTRTGRWLRRLSLDELPSLWNVLKGDMSFVGPRPLLPRYLERYSPDQARRHEVRPGITGWAQVNGRNVTTWEKRFQLDLWYIDHCSFWLDVRIMAMTAWKVITGEGVSAPGHATMPEFMGGSHDGRR